MPRLPPKLGTIIINKDIKIVWHWNEFKVFRTHSFVTYHIKYMGTCFSLYYGHRDCTRKNARAVAYRAAVKWLQKLFNSQYDINALDPNHLPPLEKS